MGSEGHEHFLEVEIASAPAKISGNVKHPSFAEGPFTVLALEQSSGQIFLADSDKKGDFSLPLLAPGAYNLYAWSSLNDAEYRNSDFLRRYEDARVTVSIGAGEVNSGITLDLIEVAP